MPQPNFAIELSATPSFRPRRMNLQSARCTGKTHCCKHHASTASVTAWWTLLCRHATRSLRGFRASESSEFARSSNVGNSISTVCEALKRVEFRFHGTCEDFPFPRYLRGLAASGSFAWLRCYHVAIPSLTSSEPISLKMWKRNSARSNTSHMCREPRKISSS